MGRIDIYLPNDVEQALRQWCYDNDKSLSKAVRRIVEKHILGLDVPGSAEAPQTPVPRNRELDQHERQLAQERMYPPRKPKPGPFQQWKGQECVFGANQCKKYGRAHTHLQSECDDEERTQKTASAILANWAEKEENHDGEV